MSEWHVTPDYIINNWTDELFNLMVEKLVERKGRIPGALQEPKPQQDSSVSIETLAAMSRGMIKVEKSGN